MQLGFDHADERAHASSVGGKNPGGWRLIERMVQQLANTRHRQSRPPSTARVTTRNHCEAWVYSQRRAGPAECRGTLHTSSPGRLCSGASHLSMHGTWMAAVLGSALARSSAIEALRSSGACSPSLLVLLQVTIPADTSCARSGDPDPPLPAPSPRLTRSRRLSIPLTHPHPHLLDLAGSPGQQELARARRQAEFLRLALDAEGSTHRPVAQRRTRTALEQRFLRLCLRYRLPTCRR